MENSTDKNPGLITGILFSITLLILSFAGTASATSAGNIHENITAEYFESIKDNGAELRQFFLEMPKGGDLHNHLSGALFAEEIIDIAAKMNLSFDPQTGTLPWNQSTIGLISMNNVYNNATLYQTVVRDWSMKEYPWQYIPGHDKFFATFSEFSPAKNNSLMIEILRHRAEDENVIYIETMLSGMGNKPLKVDWNDNFSLMTKNISKDDIREQADIVAKNIDSYDRHRAGGNVTIRYILQVNRNMIKEEVFSSMLLAFESANRSDLFVGVNMVGPEDYYRARTDYMLHMKLLEYFHEKYPDVKITLHAGELVSGLVPPQDLRFHVHEAISTGHASRIGHGVDIMWEHNSKETMKQMAKQKIPVEILLTSNEQILGIKGKEHPFPVYLKYGVPIVIATDDPGIERTDLTEEFVRAAATYPDISYYSYKQFIRNSIEYSFIDGKSLFAERGDYVKPVVECNGFRMQLPVRTNKCKAFLSENKKADIQWELEQRLAEFEKSIALEHSIIVRYSNINI